MSIVIALIGAGSNYTPELIEGILGQDATRLPVSEIRLYDIDGGRLDIMAGLSKRMIAHAGRHVALVAHRDLDAALRGVDFVITQIRVGGLTSRYLDETIPVKYGIIGQETTGPGGMFKALRTIPIMVEIARAVERCAPTAWILNYTNPSGIITEAVQRHSGARIVGLCSSIPGLSDTITTHYAAEYGPLEIASIGLNHLGFIHRITAGEREVTRPIMQRLAEDGGPFASSGHLRPWVKATNTFPVSYLDYFFFPEQQLAKQRAAPLPRSRQIMKHQRELFAQAADVTTVTKPEALKRRGGGGYAGVTFTALAGILNNTGERLVCSVRNNGAVAGIEDAAVVEVLCSLGTNGPVPLCRNDVIPLACRGLVQAVKTYETLTVQAAMERRRDLCYQAMLNHPLCGDLDVAVSLVDEMIDAHGLDYQ